MDNLSKFIGGIVLIVFAFLYGIFSWGFVLYKFWYWFILPVFTQLPLITFYQAAGLSMFIALFKNNAATPSMFEGNDKHNTEVAITNIIVPILILLMAWTFKSLFM